MDSSNQECPICFTNFYQKCPCCNQVYHGCCLEDGLLDGKACQHEQQKKDRKTSNLCCAKCSQALCIMLLPCQHLVCGSCAKKDLKSQNDGQHIKKKYVCPLCRSISHGALSITFNPQKEMMISLGGKEYPTKLIFNKRILNKIIDKFMMKVDQKQMMEFYGSALDPTRKHQHA